MEAELQELDKDKSKPLNDKQEKFCQEYILCLNKGKAYSIAYQKPYETTEQINQCSSAGCRLYGNERIHARIQELRDEANKNCDVSLAWLLKEQTEALIMMKKGKREMKLNIDGKPVPTGEVEIDYKAINGAIKNIADFTGLSKKVIEASLNANVKANVSKVDNLADTLFSDD